MTATAEGFDPVHKYLLVMEHRLGQAAAEVDLALIHQAAKPDGGGLLGPIKVGLVGAPPARQRLDYHAGDGEEQLLSHHTGTLIDLRGRTNLIQLAGACRKARAVVSVDAGPMHVAAGVGTPTLAIVGNDAEAVGASPIRLWLPRCSSLTRTVSSSSCSLCSNNRFRNDGCLVEGHPCMRDVLPEQVSNWLSSVPGLPERWHAR